MYIRCVHIILHSTNFYVDNFVFYENEFSFVLNPSAVLQHPSLQRISTLNPHK